MAMTMTDAIADLSRPDPASPVLTGKQRQLVQGLLVHGEVTAACKAAGVSRTTAYRWMGQPAFTAALRVADREVLTATSRRLARLGVKAVEVLEETLDDPEAPAAVRVRAADAVLTKLLQIRDAVDLDERLTALEAAAQEQEAHRG